MKRVNESFLEWQKVAVLDYDPEKKLFLVRNETDCSEDGKPPVFETSKSSDLWIPRRKKSLPKWLHKDLEELIAIARRSRQLRPRLKWIKDELEVNIKEMKLEFKRAINSLSYLDITGQNPNLIAEFQNEKLKNVIEPHRKGHLVKLNYSFKERFESFRCKTLWNQPQAVQALNLVQR
ncbi:dynein heavy chain 1, axonemal [Caerostris extrusa]|uniref:Dynein heavy chain 1, axonemal n=1 Tax=Caerostris extrusa TaxID=172846 RepID=A0AAV4WYZ4_CAEEX|nr:dynein heavy chain 1, axonemal [Caerostris extrusa]